MVIIVSFLISCDDNDIVSGRNEYEKKLTRISFVESHIDFISLSYNQKGDMNSAYIKYFGINPNIREYITWSNHENIRQFDKLVDYGPENQMKSIFVKEVTNPNRKIYSFVDGINETGLTREYSNIEIEYIENIVIDLIISDTLLAHDYNFDLTTNEINIISTVLDNPQTKYEYSASYVSKKKPTPFKDLYFLGSHFLNISPIFVFDELLENFTIKPYQNNGWIEKEYSYDYKYDRDGYPITINEYVNGNSLPKTIINLEWDDIKNASSIDTVK